MPQMAPISWLTLFIYFSIIFMLFNCLNYFITTYNSPLNELKTFSTNSLTWKW
uniref:ATP synthase complex subunit 8 n=1 Tax=Thaumatosmylus hainanus TaxID=2713041 RepID=A0A6G6C5V2_9NEOP|nr:ATP synthase F0 subunit 8 [Thaumatosmylus hainanus]QID76379.1 ATP synthase F0 subunit 8 [Thaumatosmylus hainanus]